MCAVWSTDNISKVHHKYTRDISRSDWRTHLYPTSRPMDQVRRHAWCTMFNACRFAVALRRGRRKLNRGFGSIFRGDAVDVPLSCHRLDPESGAVVAANRNDRFLGRIDPSVSPLQTTPREKERGNIAHLTPNPSILTSSRFLDELKTQLINILLMLWAGPLKCRNTKNNIRCRSNVQ